MALVCLFPQEDGSSQPTFSSRGQLLHLQCGGSFLCSNEGVCSALSEPPTPALWHGFCTSARRLCLIWSNITGHAALSNPRLDLMRSNGKCPAKPPKKRKEITRLHASHDKLHTNTKKTNTRPTPPEGPGKVVGMDSALRATQSQSELMIAQTSTPATPPHNPGDSSLQPPGRSGGLDVQLEEGPLRCFKF